MGRTLHLSKEIKENQEKYIYNTKNFVFIIVIPDSAHCYLILNCCIYCTLIWYGILDDTLFSCCCYGKLPWTWVYQILCSSFHKLKSSCHIAGFLTRDLERTNFQGHSVPPVPHCSYGTTISTFLLISARAIFSSLHVSPYISEPATLSCLSSPSATSLSNSSKKCYLPLRWLDWACLNTLRNPHYFKNYNLNYICKIPLPYTAMYHFSMYQRSWVLKSGYFGGAVILRIRGDFWKRMNHFHYIFLEFSWMFFGWVI